MVWTSVSMPQYLADHYSTTPYIVLEGPKREVLGHVVDNHVPVGHDSVYVQEHEDYESALRFAFAITEPTEAIGEGQTVLDINIDQLTVVLASEI